MINKPEKPANIDKQIQKINEVFFLNFDIIIVLNLSLLFYLLKDLIHPFRTLLLPTLSQHVQGGHEGGVRQQISRYYKRVILSI